MNQRFTPVMQSLQGIRAKWEKEHKELLKKADEILEDIRQLDLVIAATSGKAVEAAFKRQDAFNVPKNLAKE